MEKIRILFLINNLQYGGAETVLADLVNRLDPARFDLWVGGLFGLGPVRERIHLPPEKVVSFGFRWSIHHIDLPAYLRLYRFLRSRRIQIVHTHLPTTNTLGRITARLAGVPIIVSTEHNMYHKKSRFAILADRVLARITNQLIAVSEEVRSFASRQSRIPPERFLVIHNGIDCDGIKALPPGRRIRKYRELGLDPGQPIVLNVGRLTEQKGQTLLLEAARRVIVGYPKAVFLIAGGGPLEDELRRQARRLGLGDHVRFLGAREDIYELMQISSLFALPSLWEGHSLSLLEAAACGLPIVATRVGGTSEIIRDGENGVLIPPGDIPALTDAIEKLLSSPRLRKRMGRTGQRIVCRLFSSEIMTRKMGDLYHALWSADPHADSPKG